MLNELCILELTSTSVGRLGCSGHCRIPEFAFQQTLLGKCAVLEDGGWAVWPLLSSPGVEIGNIL